MKRILIYILLLACAATSVRCTEEAAAPEEEPAETSVALRDYVGSLSLDSETLESLMP